MKSCWIVNWRRLGFLLCCASLFGQAQANVTSTNKTFFLPRPPGREWFVDYVTFYRSCRIADNPECTRIGASWQVTPFFRQTLEKDRLGGYFGAHNSSLLRYGNSSTDPGRNKVDIGSDFLIHNAFEFKRPYNIVTNQLYLKDEPTSQVNIGQAHIPYQQLRYYSKTPTTAKNIPSAMIGVAPGDGPFGWAAFSAQAYQDGVKNFRLSSNGKITGEFSLKPESRAYGVRFGGYFTVPNVGFLRVNVPLVRVENTLDIYFSQAGDRMSEYLHGDYGHEYAPLNASRATFNDEQSRGPGEVNGAPLFVTTYDVYKDPMANQANAQEPLTKLKIYTGRLKSEFGLGDIEVTLGKRFLDAENFDCAGFVSLTVPASNQSTGEFLFEPMRGNGKHFELCAGIEGSLDLFSFQDVAVEGFYTLGTGYIFKGDEIRTLDVFLDSKIQFPWQRYFLAGQLGVAGPLTPLANLTTLKVDVRPGFKMEGFAGIGITTPYFKADLGWGFWAKEAEKIRLKDGWTDNKYAVVNSADYRAYEPLDFSVDSPHTLGTTDNTAILADELDLSSAATPTQFSQSLWLNLNYTCNYFVKPIELAVGGAYEFGHDAAAMTNWSIWCKAVVAF